VVPTFISLSFTIPLREYELVFFIPEVFLTLFRFLNRRAFQLFFDFFTVIRPSSPPSMDRLLCPFFPPRSPFRRKRRNFFFTSFLSVNSFRRAGLSPTPPCFRCRVMLGALSLKGLPHRSIFLQKALFVMFPHSFKKPVRPSATSFFFPPNFLYVP